MNVETVSRATPLRGRRPGRYFTPDVVADFTTVQLKQTGPDVVAVTGGTGNGVTDTYKVSIAYRDGFMSAGTLVIAGPNAAEKARRSGAILLEKLQQAGFTLRRDERRGARRRRLRAGRGDGDRRPAGGGAARRGARPATAAVERFTKEFAPLVTSGFAGTTGYTTGRPPVREVFAYWPALIAKSAVTPVVEVV